MEVECAGACVNAPMVQIGSDNYEDLTPESFNQLLDDIAAGRPIWPGPRIDRQFSAPEGGPKTLVDAGLPGQDRKGTVHTIPGAPTPSPSPKKRK